MSEPVVRIPSQRPSWGWVAWLSCVAVVVAACDAMSSVALAGGDFAGAKADAHCDRRFVTDGGQPAAFCQEIVGTVAASQFADDCRTRHHASAGPGACPREHVLAGCKLLEKHDDDSIVWDWYYDVSDLVADAGPEGAQAFDSRARSVEEVAAMCADRSRYESGAELVKP